MPVNGIIALRGFVFAFVSISCFIHGIFNIWKEDTCDDLVSPPLRADLEARDAEWKPSCPMHSYTNREVRECWNEGHNSSNATIFFLGDSHQRNLFVGFAQKFARYRAKGKVYRNLSFSSDDYNFTMEYRFMPSINGSFINTFRMWKELSLIPTLVVIGCTLHPILDSHASDSSRFEFRQNLTRLLTHLDNLARKTTIMWYVQPPVIEEKIEIQRKFIDNHQVNLYNDLIMEVLSRTRVTLWTSAREIALDSRKLYRDDIHVGNSTISYYIQVLSNFHCNQRFKFPEGTCCNSQRSKITVPTRFQGAVKGSVKSIILGFLILSLTGMTTGFLLHKTWRASRVDANADDFQQLLPMETGSSISNYHSSSVSHVLDLIPGAFGRIVTISLCLGYVYIADRKPIFIKEELRDFTVPFVYVTVTLVLILDIFNYHRTSQKWNEKLELNESRGTILVLYLLFKINESAQQWPWTLIIYFLESTFVILAGVDLFIYSYNSRKPMAFLHYIKVIMKHNIVLILLCWILRQPYVAYGIYLVIAISHSITYVIFALPPRTIHQEGLNPLMNMCLKLLAISFLYMISRIFEDYEMKAADIAFRKVFATNEGTTNQWHQRWRMDRFNFMYGIVIGMSFIVANADPIAEKLDFYSKTSLGKVMYTLSALLGTLVCLSFPYWSIGRYSSISDISDVYTIFVIFLVAGFVILKGLLMKVNYHSRILAQLGSLWREIYLLHFHIWCSNDGTAFLVLVPFSKLLNFVVVTLILLIVAQAIHESLQENDPIDG